MTLALCMIVKDEEKVLARCLDSVAGLFDEIVIVDTGSSDKTKSIAAEYTGKIYDFTWTDDFSAARNFSFSKAEADYVMWLDADDVLLPGDCQALKDLKTSGKMENADVWMMRYNTAFDENMNPTFYYYRERIVRKSMNFRWQGRVHEALEYSGKISYSEIAVTHRSIKTTYSKRNLMIYKKQIEEGGKLSLRDTFYYARELYYHKYYDEAEKILEAFVQNENAWLENRLEGAKILSYCLRDTGKIQKALEVLIYTLSFSEPRADICCEIGEVLMMQKEFKKAVFWFELALRLPNYDCSGGFVNSDCFGYLPCIELCVCHDKIGNRALAQQYNLMAGTYRPNSEAYRQNLIYFSTHPVTDKSREE